MVDINDLTLKQLKEIAKQFSGGAVPNAVPPHSWAIGKIYLIRTVTMIDTGRLVEVGDHELVLEDAAWIADTGRFADAVAKAEFGEVEPFPAGRVILGRGAVIDAVEIKLAPRSQK